MAKQSFASGIGRTARLMGTNMHGIITGMAERRIVASATERRSYTGPLWHVVYTDPQAEKRVLHDIAHDLSFEAYTPIERFAKRVRGRLTDIERPFFPRYVFVMVDPYRQEWQRVLDIDGVADVLGQPALGSDGAPSHLPAGCIEAMRHAEECGLFDRTPTSPNKFKVGERVLVSEGPFAGFNAVIEEFIAKLHSATASKRAKVLVEFMGRMSKAEIDLTALEKL
jgi:transcription antitermination factor NusG